jgi:hypothetical protein
MRLSKEPQPAGLLPTCHGGGVEAKPCFAPPGRHARPSAKTLPGLPPEAPIRSVGSLGNFWGPQSARKSFKNFPTYAWPPPNVRFAQKIRLNQ